MKPDIMDKQGQSFLERHNACTHGYHFAMQNYRTMTEAFQKCDNKSWIIWACIKPGVLTVQELRLFAVFCARQNIDKLKDPRSLRAIDIAQRHAYGLATDQELHEARIAAAAAYAAATTATAYAADAAYAAAADVAADVAYAYAAYAAAYAAAAATAYAAAAGINHAQIDYLRSNTKPNWNA